MEAEGEARGHLWSNSQEMMRIRNQSREGVKGEKKPIGLGYGDKTS